MLKRGKERERERVGKEKGKAILLDLIFLLKNLNPEESNII